MPNKTTQINLAVPNQVKYIIKKAAQFSNETMTELVSRTIYERALGRLKALGFMEITVQVYENTGEIFEPINNLFPNESHKEKQEVVIDENEIDDPLVAQLTVEE